MIQSMQSVLISKPRAKPNYHSYHRSDFLMRVNQLMWNKNCIGIPPVSQNNPLKKELSTNN